MEEKISPGICPESKSRGYFMINRVNGKGHFNAYNFYSVGFIQGGVAYV